MPYLFRKYFMVSSTREIESCVLNTSISASSPPMKPSVSTVPRPMKFDVRDVTVAGTVVIIVDGDVPSASVDDFRGAQPAGPVFQQ